MDIDLDKYFRSGSKSRRVAELLLTGEPLSRQELAEAAQVAVTNVNRVVAVLEGAGARVERSVASDGHQAQFQLRSIGEPPRKRTSPSVGTEAKVVGATQVGDDILVDFVSEKLRWRGKLMSTRTTVPFGKTGVVRAVEGESLDALMVRLDVEGAQLPLGFIIPVAD